MIQSRSSQSDGVKDLYGWGTHQDKLTKASFDKNKIFFIKKLFITNYKHFITLRGWLDKLFLGSLYNPEHFYFRNLFLVTKNAGGVYFE